MSNAPENAVTSSAATSNEASLEALLRQAPPTVYVNDQTPVSQVITCFDADPNCVAVLVMQGESFVNVLSREALAAQFTRPFFRELYLAKPVARLLKGWELAPLELSEQASINDAIAAALNRPASSRYEPLVVLREDGSRAVLDLHYVLIQECQLLERTLTALERQREATASAERERELLHDRLVAASREAGRAEVATGVLHNVGNVLNSVNVSASVVTRTLQQSRLPNFRRLANLVQEHSADLSAFLTDDPRGKQIPAYLITLVDLLEQEQQGVASEMAEMVRSLEHIKQVVQTQQSHARVASVIEAARPDELIEEALRVNLSSFERHNVKIDCRVASPEPVAIDKHKTLGILINLISNAKNALKSCDRPDRRITLVFERFLRDAGMCARFVVSDNGIGIPSQNLTRIFSHGFTTRTEGHGFGLHSAANAAREMDGTLSVHSDGPGTGATFTLELPEKPSELFGQSQLKVSA